MSYVKAITILVVLVLVVSQHVESKEELWKTCRKLRYVIIRKTLNGTPKEVINIARGYRIVTLKFLNEGLGKVIRSMEALLNEEECSDSSLEYLQMMALCYSVRDLDMISKATDAYANKCLTSEYVNQKVKSAVAGSTVDFLSPALIKKFHEFDWGNRPALRDATDIATLKYCAIMNALYLGFPKQHHNPKDIFSDGVASPAVWSYMNEKLFNPCDSYLQSVGPFMVKLGDAAKFYNGKLDKLITTLDQEAKDAIFRYMYCHSVQFGKETVVNILADRLIQGS